MHVDNEGNPYLISDYYVGTNKQNGDLSKFDSAGNIAFNRSFAGSLGALMILEDGTEILTSIADSPVFPTKDTLLPYPPNQPHDPPAQPSIPLPREVSVVIMVADPSGRVTHSSLLGGADRENLFEPFAFNPAPRGSVISLFGTGWGSYSRERFGQVRESDVETLAIHLPQKGSGISSSKHHSATAERLTASTPSTISLNSA